MESCVLVDPFRCRVWSLHDRLEESLTEDSCKDEIESFQVHGQRAGALGRPVRDDPEYDVEVICGARRLLVARVLKLPLLIEVRELTDLEAIIAMHVEDIRKDKSPYEQGLAYSRWLRGGYFSTQEEMANVLKVSPSKVSRLLKMSRLPSVVVSAFGNPGDIREGWGERLTELMEDPIRKPPAIRAARAIATSSSHLQACDVYRKLLAATAPTDCGGRKIGSATREEVVLDEEGVVLYRVKHRRESVVFELPLERMSARTLEALQQAIKGVLIASPEVVIWDEDCEREPGPVAGHDAVSV
jgi:ParB family chromosome partitioning protein